MSDRLDSTALLDLEDSIVGGVLLRPDTISVLDIQPWHMKHLRPRHTFAAMRQLEASRTPIDGVNLWAEIERMGVMDAIGGDYLALAAMRVPTPDNMAYYAAQIRDAWLGREVVDALANTLDAARRMELNGAELLSLALGAITKLDAGQSSAATKSIGTVVRERMVELHTIAERRANGEQVLTGFPTGIAKLDEQMGGWQSRIVSVLAARPGMGKSSALLATAEACSSAGYGVHLFSLEDSEQAYADRSMSRASGVPASKIRALKFNRGEMDDLGDASRELDKRTGWIIDSRSDVTAEEIVRSVRRNRRDNGTRVVMVDYLQYVAKSNPRTPTHEHLGEAMSIFANAAKADNMAYLVASQLNREVEKRTDRRPYMSDLKESGAIEERAKCVVGMYRGAYYGDESTAKEGVDYHAQWPSQPFKPNRERWNATVQMLVLKNNNGECATVFANWAGPLTKIW